MRREAVVGDEAPPRAGNTYHCPCGKLAYRSERLAREAHRRFAWRIRTYRCPDAPGVAYHVTNTEKNR